MNRFLSLMAGCLSGGLALLAAGEAHAVCKLIVNVDLTGSMMEVRADGQTKCFVAQNSALLVLEAFRAGKDFDVTSPMSGFLDRVEYNTNCAGQADRLVSVWVFRGDTMAPLFPGFLPVEDAYVAAISSGEIVDPLTLLPTNNCPGGSTPMAQSMCRVARVFPA